MKVLTFKQLSEEPCRDTVIVFNNDKPYLLNKHEEIAINLETGAYFPATKNLLDCRICKISIVTPLSVYGKSLSKPVQDLPVTSLFLKNANICIKLFDYNNNECQYFNLKTGVISKIDSTTIVIFMKDSYLLAEDY